MALSAARTGMTWRPVANWTSSIASTTVGSDRARVSVFPTLRTGNTWYFWTISFRTRRRMSGSTSTRPRLITGMPYFRLRKSRRSSSLRKPSRVSTTARRSPVRRWSATAFWAWSWVSSPSLTRRSSNRGFMRAGPLRCRPSRPRLASREGAVDQVHEAVQPRALLEEGDALVVRHLLGEGLGDQPRDQDHRELLVDPPDRVEHDQPVHVRHHDVDDGQLRRLLLELPERLLPRAGADDLVPLEGEDVVEDIQDRGRVVGDQDACHIRPGRVNSARVESQIGTGFSSGRKRQQGPYQSARPGIPAGSAGPPRLGQAELGAKRLISLVLVEDQVDPAQARVRHAGEVSPERPHHRIGRVLGIEPPDARAERRERQRVEAQVL